MAISPKPLALYSMENRSAVSWNKNIMATAGPDPVESTLMVCDYIGYRLKLAEIDWEYRPQYWFPGREHLMLRELAYNFELRYKTKLEKLINKMEFSLNSIQDEYQEILDWLLGQRIT